jgi:hypothetical protein
MQAPTPPQPNATTEQMAFIAQLIDNVQRDKDNVRIQSDIEINELKNVGDNYEKVRETLEKRYTEELVNEKYTDAFITLSIMQDIQHQGFMKFNVSIPAGMNKLKHKNIDRAQIDKVLTKHTLSDKPMVYDSEKYKKTFACAEPAGILETCDSPTAIPFYIGLATCCKPFNTFMTEHQQVLRTHFDLLLRTPGPRQTFKKHHAYFQTLDDNQSVPQYMHIYFLHRYLPDNIATYFASNLTIFQKDPNLQAQRQSTYITGYTDEVPGIHYYRRLLLIATYCQFIRLVTLMFLEVYTFHRDKFQNLINASTLKGYQKSNPIEMFTIIIKTIIYMATNTMKTSSLTIPTTISYEEAHRDLKNLVTDNIFQKIILHKIIQQEMEYFDAMDHYDRKVYGVTTFNRLFKDIPDKEVQLEFVNFFADMFQHCISILEPSWDITHVMLERFFTCIVMSNVFEVSNLSTQSTLQPILKNITMENQSLFSSIQDVKNRIKELDKQDFAMVQQLKQQQQQTDKLNTDITKKLSDVRQKQNQIDNEVKTIEQRSFSLGRKRFEVKQLEQDTIDMEQEVKGRLGGIKTNNALQQQAIRTLMNGNGGKPRRNSLVVFK